MSMSGIMVWYCTTPYNPRLWCSLSFCEREGVCGGKPPTKGIRLEACRCRVTSIWYGLTKGMLQNIIHLLVKTILFLVQQNVGLVQDGHSTPTAAVPIVPYK
jgi:hypothetical protein